MAAKYAREHDLELDTVLTFHDEGISGFRGRNAEAGRLADFLEAVKVGLVPQGSVLLVEQLDRLSRLVPRKAMRVLEDIVEAGVSVVTLNDGREYTPASLDRDPTDLLVAVLTFMRANDESATKAKRLSAAWEAKRANVAAKPLTGIVPAWLELDKQTQQIKVIPERAAIVRRIFSMTLDGTGQHSIAATLNGEGVEPWGTGKRKGLHWHRSYIAKILTNPAVIGVLHPHRTEYADGKKRRIPLDTVPHYFPAVISPETWADAQALLTAKGAPRGRQAVAPLSNILSRLATCPKCEGTMTRVQKGSSTKAGYPSLVCATAKAGAGCEYKSVRYETIERRLLQVLPGVIQDREGIDESEDIEAQIAQLEDVLLAQRQDIDVLVDELLEGPSPALAARVREKERAVSEMQSHLAGLKEHRDIMAGPLVGSRIEKAVGALQPTEDGDLDRVAANAALRGIFKRAIINWPAGTIDLEWHVGGLCRVTFGWTEGPWPPPASTEIPPSA
ncbi:recombinase [Sphingomonas sp. BHC-A]|nr:recombinase [Sphingomonas sp. BHC-A]NYI23069.1 DNA invertase Pin-like site-specific DNA recombinase [Sphingobium indicum]